MKFIDFINFSKIISKTNGRIFLRELEVELSSFKKDKLKEYKNENIPADKALKKFDEEQKQKMFLEIVGFLFENIHVVQKELEEIIKNNSENKNVDVLNMEHNEIFAIFKKIFEGGIPDKLLKQLNLNLENDLKKTL